MNKLFKLCLMMKGTQLYTSKTQCVYIMYILG